jgi:class 3 adenylate cyclase/predicted ATPase
VTDRPHSRGVEVCAHCGSPALQTARFCPHCGHRLAQAPRRRTHDFAERRQVTLLFCDLAGSTELASRIDPEEMRDVMRAYQATCARAIAPFEGNIAQTLGDGLLVYFGYPEAHEDDAGRAVRAALAIVSAVVDPAGELHRLWPDCAVRIGIHTGVVIAGEVGPWDTRLEMAITGEAPSIAARLQELAGRNQVLVGPTTRSLIEGYFQLAELGPRLIKGVHEAMPVWRVVGRTASHSRFDPSSRARGTPFVGRRPELDALHALWKRACEGDGQLVVLSGAAGIGKSRLVQAFLAELHEQRPRCLQYHCSPYFQNTALYPMVAHLQHVAGIRHEDPPRLKLRKLTRLLGPTSPHSADDVALLGRLLQVPDIVLPRQADRTPERLLEDTVRVLLDRALGVARTAPVLMFLEDAHWIDRTTMRLVNTLLRRLHGERVLAIITHRGNFPPGWSADVEVQTILLERLGATDSRCIVQHLAEHELPDRVQQEIIARSDGIPLFVEELTKAVLEANDGEAVLSVPMSLRDSLVARLDHLGSLKRVAQLGACIGRRFPYQLLRLVSDVDPDDLERGLDRLVAAELLARSGEPPDSSFDFKHALIQSAAYESLLRSERKLVHASIARDLAIYYPQACETEPEMLAHHLTAAGEHAGAVDYWFRAGQLAQQRSAHFEAIAHLNAGVSSLRQLTRSPTVDAREFDLLSALARSHMAFDGWNSPAVHEVTARARSLGAALCDPARQSEAIFGLWTYHCVRGEFAACRALTEELVPLAEREDDRTLILMADTVALVTYFCLGEFKAAEPHAARIHANYRPAEDRGLVQRLNHDPEIFAYIYESVWLWLKGLPDSAARASRRALELARDLGHPFQLCFALCNGTLAFVLRREHQPVFEQIDECLKRAKESLIPAFRAYAPLMGAPALIDRDPTPSTLARLRRCMAATETSGAGMHVPLYLIHMAEAHEHMGELPEAEAALDRAMEMAAKTGECWLDPELHRLRARLLRQSPTGDERRAEAWLRSGLQRARELDARGFELRTAIDLADLLGKQGRQREALALLQPIYASFREGLDTPDLLQASDLLARLSSSQPTGHAPDPTC